ncbi:MAG: repair protein RadC [Candidatus Berkelbacteria bacterium]|nr:repair protein RadC [Candidatus Berkelbacteria bacterium]
MTKNFTICDLPKTERPRERLIKLGSEALSAQELLALIIARGVSGKSVMNIAQELLSKYGNIKGVSEATIEQLCQIKGIGEAKATQIKACFEIARRIENQEIEQSKLKKFTLSSPKDIVKLAKPILKDKKKEYFLVFPLDSRNQIMKEEIISIGTLNANLVHPREVFKQTIANNAVSMVIVHNHPSGDINPSDEDIEITKQLIDAGNILGIQIVDHVILNNNHHFSFKDNHIFF